MTSIFKKTREVTNQDFLKSYLWRVVLPHIPQYTSHKLTGNVATSGPSASNSSGGFFTKVEHFASGLASLAIGLGENALGMESDYVIGLNDPIEVSFRVTNVSLPMYTTSPNRVTYGNTYWQTPSNMEIGSLTLDIVETQDGKTMKYLQAWNNLMLNRNAHGNITYNPPAMYKKPIYAYHLTGMKQDLIEFKFDGAYIGGIENQTKDYESSDWFKLSLTLPVDKMSYRILSTDEITQATLLYNQTIALKRGLNIDRTQISNEVHDFLLTHLGI